MARLKLSCAQNRFLKSLARTPAALRPLRQLRRSTSVSCNYPQQDLCVYHGTDAEEAGGSVGLTRWNRPDM